MASLEGLTFLDGHTTLLALVGALALVLLMVEDVLPHHHTAAVDAGNFDVRANGFMGLDLNSDALGMTVLVSTALDGLELTSLIMASHFIIS